MKISIIVPTLDRQEALIGLLKRIQSLPSEEFELIVVDDSKSSLSEDFLSQSGDRLVYLHRGQKLGVSSARNVGSKYAKGEYLIFLDDDDVVTDSWLSDFYAMMVHKPDLVYCDMRLIQPNGRVAAVSASKNRRGIVIPGAWMIRKEIFEKAGGFDARLKFAENTEFFFRLDKFKLKINYIKKENFIYLQSPDGGSKNLQNMLDSLRIILEKHGDYLNAHVKHLYHQNIGVIEMRFGNFELARHHLWRSWYFKPQRISTLARIALAYLPIVSKRIYTLEIAGR